MKLLIWNCQGASSSGFLRVLKDLLKRHNVACLGLLEPKVSGQHANEICKSIGFKNWVRVESVGFGGGLWVFWKDQFHVDILFTHPQFFFFLQI